MKYYKTESRNITYAEYWRIATSRKGLLQAWVHKLLRVPLKLTEGIPEPTTFADRITPKEELPQHLRAQLEIGTAECVAMGFGNICYCSAKNKLMRGDGAGVVLTHAAGETVANIISVKLNARESYVIAFRSLLVDGTVIATTNRRRQFNDPPGFQIKRMPSRSAAELWSKHQRRIQKFRTRRSLQTFSGMAGYEMFFEVSTKRIFKALVERRIWVEMTADEIEAARKRLASRVASK